MQDGHLGGDWRRDVPSDLAAAWNLVEEFSVSRTIMNMQLCVYQRIRMAAIKELEQTITGFRGIS
jgi:hypothetical protein